MEITIYEIIEEAENKYIGWWGENGYKDILNGWIGNLESLMKKGKEAGDNPTIEDCATISMNILKNEFNEFNEWDRDLIFIASFKIADKSRNPFSEELTHAICINFQDIVLNKS